MISSNSGCARGSDFINSTSCGAKNHQSSHGSTAFVLPLSKYPLLHPPLKGLEVMIANVDVFLATNDVAKF